MYGENKPEPLIKNSDGFKLDVVSVFPTLQGEGPFAGRPATFIRLAGCHLQCWFCDTDFTSNRYFITPAELLCKCEDYAQDLVVLTGGEPLRQNIVPLCLLLTGHHFQVQIETAGSFWPDDRNTALFEERVRLKRVHIVVSPKSGYLHPKIIELAHSWKYIITSDDPLDPAGLPTFGTQISRLHASQVARPPQHVKPWEIYLQPCDESLIGDKETWRKCVRACLAHGYRLSLQQHKLLELP